MSSASAWVPKPRYLAQLPIACRSGLPFNFVWGPRAGIIIFLKLLVEIMKKRAGVGRVGSGNSRFVFSMLVSKVVY